MQYPIQHDWGHFHAEFERRLAELFDKIEHAGLPFELFEAYRSPGRQRYLYRKGRFGPFKSKRIVTRAKPWWSFHQYGMAADIVLRDPCWSWRSGPEWKQMHDLAASCDLVTLDVEAPHVQFPTTIHRLRAGDYPPDGGLRWASNLTEMIAAYPRGAPPAPEIEAEPLDRPYLADLALPWRVVS